LYTAAFNAVVNRPPATEETIEVHRYGFLTSKYLSFNEHIDSYIFDPAAGLDGKAIFNENVTVIDPAKAIDTFNDNLSNSDNLISQFADKYDRLIDGVLQLSDLNAPTDMEIILLQDDTIGHVGILIRNPEPIWSPKMPLNQSPAPVSIQNSMGTSTYSAVYSKDRSCLFICIFWSYRFYNSVFYLLYYDVTCIFCF